MFEADEKQNLVRYVSPIRVARNASFAMVPRKVWGRIYQVH